jgi:hypothetical protein
MRVEKSYKLPEKTAFYSISLCLSQEGIAILRAMSWFIPCSSLPPHLKGMPFSAGG